MNVVSESFGAFGPDSVVGERYRLIQKLSPGAEPVFLAEDLQTGARCSLGFLAAGPGLSERLSSEQEAADRIRQAKNSIKHMGHSFVMAPIASGVLPGGGGGYRVWLGDLEGFKPLSVLRSGGRMSLSGAAAIVVRAVLALDALAKANVKPRVFGADCIWAKGAADSEQEQVAVLGGFLRSDAEAQGAHLDVLAKIFYELVMGEAPSGAVPFELSSPGSVGPAVDALVHLLGSRDPGKRAALALEVVRAQDVVSRFRMASPSITNESSADSFGLAVPSAEGAPVSAAGAAAPAKTAQTVLPKPKMTMASMPDGAGRSAMQMIRYYVIGLSVIVVSIVVAAIVRSSDWEVGDVEPVASVASPASAKAGERSRPKDVPSAAPKKEPVVTASVSELRGRVEKDLRMGNAGGFVSNLEQLLDAEPSMAGEREIKNGVIEVLMRVMMGDQANADRLFSLIENKMGTNGPDLLYEIITTRGGSKAAKRAEDMLRSEELRGKGTAEFRIAYDFRMAKTCDEKVPLFERAGTEGDRRVLGPMQMMNRDCGRGRGGECCFGKNEAFKAALSELKKRYPQ